jgi:ribosomal protein L37E
MQSKQSDTRVSARVFTIDFEEHRTGQTRLFRTVFKDRCGRCGLPSYKEIESPPEVESFRVSNNIGAACGFWLARKATAETLCAEFQGQFEMKRISDDAFFLVLTNILIPDDPFYENSGDSGSGRSFPNREKVCSLCGKPYVFLHQGFIHFKGGNHIKRKTIYETSLKFGSADVKYPYYFCDEEAANALRKISRQFRFEESTVKFTVDAV